MDQTYDYCNCEENIEKKVKEFINSLENQGYTVQEGEKKNLIFCLMLDSI